MLITDLAPQRINTLPDTINEGQTPESLPDNAPIVSMDVNLGKKYKHADFNYKEFNAAATAIGLTEEGRSELRVRVVDSLGMMKGRQRSGEIEVAARGAEGANKTLRHEMSHEADSEAGIKIGQERRYRIGIFAGNVAIVQTGVLLAAGVADIISGNSLADSFVQYGLFAGALPAGANLWGYAAHPGEIRAREAAVSTSQQILSFDKK